jgi:hypothetical protein
MPAEPLTAEYRVVIEFVVPNLIHVMRCYAEASPSLLAPSGYFLFDRSGIASIDAKDAAQAWWTAVRPNYFSSVVPPTFRLENRVGVVWNPVSTAALTGAGTNLQTTSFASQFTISCRTTNFKRIKFIWIEQAQYQAAFKYIGGTALAVQSPLFAHSVDGTDALPTNLFNWARSRNKRELAISGAVISSTYDLNDKVRRSRHIQ